MDIRDFEPLFGDWYVESKIGEGSFGKVYRIERKELGTVYTSALKWISIPQDEAEVKQLRYDGMDDASISNYYCELAGKLTNEMRIMDLLKGRSCIVSYEDHRIKQKAGQIGYDIFIRMELLTCLNDYMQTHEFSQTMVIRLGIDLCEALKLCQKYNIIHRDIKPGNIFVTDTGDFKLGDFGIARQLKQTATGLSKKGTYDYMAPEMYKENPYGSSVDIYSLGIVMYKLLNGGRLPFLPLVPNMITFSEKEKSLVRRMSGEQMPMPQHAKGRLGEIVLKACAYDPKNRYSNPGLMRDELQAIQFSQTDRDFVCEGDDKLGLIEPSNRKTPQPSPFFEETEAAGFGEHPETKGTQTGERAANGELGKPQEPTLGVFDNPGPSRNPMNEKERGMGSNFNNEGEEKENEPRPTPLKEKPWVKICSVLGGLLILAAVLFIYRAVTGNTEGTKVETIVPITTTTPEQTQQLGDAPWAADHSAQSSDDSALATDALTAHTTLTAGDVNKGIIAAGYNYTLIINNNQTVTKIGGNEKIDTGSWSGITQISANDSHAVGLCEDGRLVATGINDYGACNVGGWSNVKQVVTGYCFTAALTNDGKVLFTGFHKDNQNDCENWTDIKELFEGEDHIVGLRSDGTLVAAGFNGYNQRNISYLTNIVDGVASSQTTFAVNSEGSVYAIGKDWSGENNVNSWTNIVAIAGGNEHTVGLRSDGTVVAAGNDEFGQCDVASWTDIVSITAGQFHTVGVKSDGTLVATGKNSVGQCDVSGYKLW